MHAHYCEEQQLPYSTGSGQKSHYKYTRGPCDKQEVNNNISFGLVLLYRAINDFG